MINNIQSLYVEVSTKCNLKCPHCPRAFEPQKYKNKTLSLTKYTEMLHKFEGNFKNISLHGIGEPTLCSELPHFIEFTRKTGRFSNITFCSNLSQVSVDFYRRCFDNGLSTLLVSFDSMHAETLSLCRKNSNKDLICATLEALAAEYPERIIPITTVDEYNVQELSAIRDYFVRMGIAHWKLQNKIFFNEGRKKVYDSHTADFIENFKNDSEIHITLLHFRAHQCTMPHTSAMATVSGDIIPCCTIYRDADYILGNIFKNTLSEIYASEPAKKFFTDFQNSKQKTCAKCAMYR